VSNIKVEKFQKGTQVTWRNVHKGAIEYAFPATIVQDWPDLIVLYQPHATIARRMAGDRGIADGGQTSSQLAPASWNGKYEDYTYNGPNVLRAYHPGAEYSIIRSLSEDLDSVFGWYINIELKWRRTSIGFDSRDLVLDVRDRDGVWVLEDEDELDWATKSGVMSHTEMLTARRAADRALNDASCAAGAFGMDWTRFMPDPNWPIPVVHPDWAAPAEAVRSTRG
jgi:uncharacterized protein DUF402